MTKALTITKIIVWKRFHIGDNTVASITLKHIYKQYPLIKTKKAKKKKGENNPSPKNDQRYAVKDFNLEINDGEFVVFVGPSGCGKSTTLRMIAGLEDITAGELYIDNQLANNKEPKDRDIAMVFQSYALYPQMSAYDNIAFGLRLRKIPQKVLDKDGNPIYVVDKKQISELKKKIRELKKDPANADQIKELQAKIESLKNNPSVVKVRYKHMPKDEIDSRVQSVAEILNIKELLYRKPADMSGGQRQRVALGRCMVREPKAFLLDEPLSNLDAKLRTSMRSEIVKLHNTVKTTFVYVTHDQIEAMTMGDKIVVMKDGIIQQVDKPTNLYDYPVNKFVAGFIGTPQMNFFDVQIQRAENTLVITFKDGQTISYPLGKIRNIKSGYLDGNSHHVWLGVRGEHIKISKKGLNVLVDFVEDLGKETQIFVKAENNGGEFVIDYPKRATYKNGDTLKVDFEGEHIHLFDYENEESILDGGEK